MISVLHHTKLKRFVLFFFILVFTLLSRAQESKKQKIACVGNSITYGAAMVNREMNSYPSQLQQLMGSGVDVQNFGVSSTTLLSKGNYPYRTTRAYREALAFKPDVVLIKLGTNDSKIQNRVFLDEFEKDYKDLIKSFQEVNDQIRIILLLPVPSFVSDTTGIWGPVIKDKIIPITRKVAFDTNSELVDLHQLFIDSPQLLPDKIHPSSLGATIIAKRVYEQIRQDIDADLDMFKNLNLGEKEIRNFHGFELVDFKMGDVACKIVRPKKANKAGSWIWRARFWGHEPQTDIALLERGFHVVYCDVADLYGGPEAINRWNQFYELLINNGLSHKPVLEGMSRGGLILYNWTLANPEKVACIYADAPVLSGKSWPGGFGRSKGYSEGWTQFKNIYGLKDTMQVENYKGDPIHKTEEIARLKIPLIHVCGGADKVVPFEENTKRFEEGIGAQGGEIVVINKENIGHHPHSLSNPTRIVNFILEATNLKWNDAILPAPGSEYRSSAGWKEGTDWWAQMKDINTSCLSTENADLLLIGNSITQGWGGYRTLLTYEPGKAATEKYFEGITWLNAGISGDRTQQILWRIKNGDYQKANPKYIALAIGVNNFSNNSSAEIIAGINAVVDLIMATFPNTKLLLFGPLPTGTNKESAFRKKYEKIHDSIAALDNMDKVKYLNLMPLFIDEKGTLKSELVGGDGVHLKPGGFMVWAKAIRDQIDLD